MPVWSCTCSRRVAGHQNPAVTARYLHSEHDAVLDVGVAFSCLVVQEWAKQAVPQCGVGTRIVTTNMALTRGFAPLANCRADRI